MQIGKGGACLGKGVVQGICWEQVSYLEVVTKWIRAKCPVIVLRVPASFCVALTFLTGVSGSEGAPGHPAGAGYFSAVQTANTC